MNIPNSAGQYIGGMQRIERAIIEGSKASGVTIDPRNIQWNGGKEFLSLPWSIELVISAGAKSAKAVWSREQVVDSWERLDRADVRACVRQVVAMLVD
jgi:hypothetical protein